MKKIAITICAAALFVGCNNSGTTGENKMDSSSTAMETKSSDSSSSSSEAWVPVDSATAMKSMMEVGTPGTEQAMLAKDAGTWKTESTMWMSPESQPMKSSGTMTNKMILGGRYLEGTYKGNMMGMAFEGVSRTAYDKGSKKWVNTWIDNMSTGVMNMEGDYDDASKTTTYTGKMICPANGKWCDMKETYKKVDDNTVMMEMWGPDMKTGKLYKNMEMKMTRM